MNKIIDLSEFMVVGERIIPPGTKLLIGDRWQEDDSLYCNLVDTPTGGCADYELSAIFESNGEQIILLGLTPNLDIDDPVKTFTVTRVVSTDSFEIVDKAMINRIAEQCKEALLLDVHQQALAMRKFFGTFRDWIPPS